MRGLMVDMGAGRIDRQSLYGISTPPRTETWLPIPHHRLLEEVELGLRTTGIQVVAEKHAIARGGNHYFGVLHIANGGTDDDYGTVVGLRNSHDKSFVAGLACGSHVFVCSNLAFWGDVVISRKHTAHIERDLPRLIIAALGRLAAMQHVQENRIAAYKETAIIDKDAHDVLVRAIDAGVIAASRLPRVLNCWRGDREPEWGVDVNAAFRAGTAWRLFNAFTFILKEVTIFTLAQRTQGLHVLMDRAVGLKPFEINIPEDAEFVED